MCCNKRKLIDNCTVFWKGASISFLKLYVAYPTWENYPSCSHCSGRTPRAKEGCQNHSSSSRDGTEMTGRYATGIWRRCFVGEAFILTAFNIVHYRAELLQEYRHSSLSSRAAPARWPFRSAKWHVPSSDRKAKLSIEKSDSVNQ